MTALMPGDTQLDAKGLALARLFHAEYERLAPQFGYETRTETREFDPQSANGRLMTAVCSSILAHCPAYTLGYVDGREAAPEDAQACGATNLRAFMEAHGYQQSDLGRMFGRGRASEFLNSKRSLPLGAIRRLHIEWGVPLAALFGLEDYPAIRALPAPNEPVSAWRNIASAPKDGTELLAYFGPHVGVKQVAWTEGQNGFVFWCVDDEKFGPYMLRGYNDPYPTVWQPLPPSPSPEIKP